MSTFRRTTSLALASVFSLTLLTGYANEVSQAAVTPAEARAIATEAYIYGYSLMTTEITRVQMTNVPKPTEDLKAPTGMFSNVPRYPGANYRGVSAPNADTLYSFAWLDLSEPQVFSHPDFGSRYHLFEVVDLWMSDLANSPGSRTGDGKAANYLFTGPDWKGKVPAGVKHIPVATQYMVIAGRIFADGTEQDYKAVNAVQAQLKITPLSAWGKNYTPTAAPVDKSPAFSMTDKPQQVITDLGVKGYFDMMARLLVKAAPPAAADAPILSRMARIGIEPGKAFDLSALDSATQEALKGVPQQALKTIEGNVSAMGEIVNGWIISKGLGEYGTNYLKRATVAAFGWPANRQEDAVYPYAQVDSTGATLNGANQYTLTFPKGEEPPVKGFWSITMYEIDNGWWFVPNVLNKFTVSPRDNLKSNADGSITLYFQYESPGKDKESNWLPAPKGDFLPMLRMYWPQDKKPSVLDGTWTPPQIIKTK
ncbi:DUF1254 domain-containing protein [Oceanisphaera sp. W20_SRM_FM3]|uniref:DUF1254 domain-containing protein n=1 Tax=Oceanisphaera sp. W20_SRM_FM3 TaxID=3240267 RepID=UPI003F9BEC07